MRLLPARRRRRAPGQRAGSAALGGTEPASRGPLAGQQQHRQLSIGQPHHGQCVHTGQLHGIRREQAQVGGTAIPHWWIMTPPPPPPHEGRSGVCGKSRSDLLGTCV